MNRSSFVSFVRAVPKAYLIGGAVVVVAAAVIGGNALMRQAPPPVATSATAHVQVASVAALTAAAGPLPLTGTVTSLSEATILAQTSGQITSLAHALGDRVSAGEVIATFENASQAAAVTQAQGAYDAAEAAQARVTGSTNTNTTSATVTALASAYAAIDDAVHTRADQLFTNPKTNPVLVITVPDSQLVAGIVSERLSLEATLADARSLADPNASGDVSARAAQMSADIDTVAAFLDDLIKAVNETTVSSTLSATSLAAYQASLAAARTELASARSGLTNAQSAYDANDVTAAAASVKEAQGALDAAEANLEKTIVRSPITGTIVSLPVTEGDYVATNAQVAVVSNPGALYVDAQVTPSDAQTLSVGGTADIQNGTAAGVITFIAPALDPATGKIEVKLGIRTGASALTDGEVVSLSLMRSHAAAPAQSQLTIPIVAAKILPAGPAVFTVSTSSMLVAHPITLGTILGNRVVVVDGLTPDMQIVTDARGLAEGQTVIVDAATSTP